VIILFAPRDLASRERKFHGTACPTRELPFRRHKVAGDGEPQEKKPVYQGFSSFFSGSNFSEAELMQ